MLDFCNIEGERGNAHLRPILIVAADTGLRRRELLTLKSPDLDFDRGVITIRRVNAKRNQMREIPMTPRVKEQLQKLVSADSDVLLFGGLKEFRRSFMTACRNCEITDLHFHDLRHAFVSRAILAGIPQAVVLSASGHSHNSAEWKKYLNMTPNQLQFLLEPISGQKQADVVRYAEEVMRGLRRALRFDDVENLFAPSAKSGSESAENASEKGFLSRT